VDPFRRLVGRPGRGIGLLQGHTAYLRTYDTEKATYIYASSGIQTHDTSTRIVLDCTLLDSVTSIMGCSNFFFCKITDHSGRAV
jgi:hypothetical protein